MSYTSPLPTYCPEATVSDGDVSLGGQSQQQAVPSGPPLVHAKPAARKYNKKELKLRLNYADAKQWSLLHKRQLLSPLPLPDGIEIKIRQWFDLVDGDHSGYLNAEELEAALKTSGIPANTTAINEVIKLLDFDHDGEIDWRDFHHFLCYEVMADKDPLGAEYVLPSGMALPISSMIGAIRRRKLLDDVVEGGSSRQHWVAEGPEFLRHLLESEQYKGLSPEMLRRILSFKAPPSKAADPDAMEQHKYRIARLRRALLGSLSRGEGTPISIPDLWSDEEDGGVRASGSGGGSRGRRSFRGTATGSGTGSGSRGSTQEGAPGPRSRSEVRAKHESWSCTNSPREGFRSRSQSRGGDMGAAGRVGVPSQRRKRTADGAGTGDGAEVAARGSVAGDAGDLEEPNEAERRAARARFRAAAALALLESVLEAQELQREHQAKQQQECHGQQQDEQSVAVDRKDRAFLTCVSPTASPLPTPRTAPSSAPTPPPTTSGELKGAAAEAVGAIQAASQFVSDIRRMDSLLERHHQRTGKPPPRPSPGIALSSLRANSPRHVVVVPPQVSIASETVQPAAASPSARSGLGVLKLGLGAAGRRRSGDGGGAMLPADVIAAAAARLAQAEVQRRSLEAEHLEPPGNGSACETGTGDASMAGYSWLGDTALGNMAVRDTGSGSSQDSLTAYRGDGGGQVALQGGAPSAWAGVRVPTPSPNASGRPSDGNVSVPEAPVPRLSLRSVQRSVSSGPGPFAARLVRSAKAMWQHHGPLSARRTGGSEGQPSDAAPRVGSATGDAASIVSLGHSGVAAGGTGTECPGSSEFSPQDCRAAETPGGAATPALAVEAQPQQQQHTQHQQPSFHRLHHYYGQHTSQQPSRPAPSPYLHRSHSPQPRLHRGRTEAMAAAAAIKRNAWGMQGPTPPSSSAGLRPTGARPTTHNGTMAPSSTASRGTANKRFASVHDMNPDPRVIVQRPSTGVPPAANVTAPVSNAAAAPGGALTVVHVQTMSPGNFGVALRVDVTQEALNASARPKARHAQSPSRGQQPTHGSLLSPTTGQQLDHGVEVVPVEWVASVSRQPSQLGMSQRPSSGLHGAPQSPCMSPHFAAVGGANVVPAGLLRRSFELERRTAGSWRSSAGVSPSSGRLKRTCLAASLRVSTSALPSNGQVPDADVGRWSASGVPRQSAGGPPATPPSASSPASGDSNSGTGMANVVATAPSRLSGGGSGQRLTGPLFGGSCVPKAGAQQIRGLGRQQPQAKGSSGGVSAGDAVSPQTNANWPWPWEGELCVVSKGAPTRSEPDKSEGEAHSPPV